MKNSNFTFKAIVFLLICFFSMAVTPEVEGQTDFSIYSHDVENVDFLGLSLGHGEEGNRKHVAVVRQSDSYLMEGGDISLIAGTQFGVDSTEQVKIYGDLLIISNLSALEDAFNVVTRLSVNGGKKFITSKTSLTPYVGIGAQIMYISANGDSVSDTDLAFRIGCEVRIANKVRLGLEFAEAQASSTTFSVGLIF